MTANPVLPSLFKRVRIVSVRPSQYVHAFAFQELTIGLSSALHALGCVVDVTDNEPLWSGGVNLVIGAHLLKPSELPPQNSVIFNLEQLGRDGIARHESYFNLLRRYAVLDYSERNAVRIREETGNPHVQALRIGYRAELSRIASSPEPDVDVLFYGSVNPRRQRVLDGLEAAGLKLKKLFGVYADERDHWIGRSKIVLNLHFYEDKVHEIVRSSYLLANRKAVVCECDEDTEIDASLRDAMACVPYDRLVETCVQLLRDDSRRRELERRGFEIFSQRDQARALADTLPKLARPLPGRINLGSGKDWQQDALNIDVDPKANPDVICDLSAADALDGVYFSRRFGLLQLEPGGFEAIDTADVLEHVPDLVGLMTRSLELLKVGGEMRNSVPYDLSYGAWQDPTHVRAFNERSWLYYTDWHWYLGWRQSRFDLVQNEMILSPLGHELRSGGTPDEQIYRTPRAVDSMRVTLRKRLLDAEERVRANAWYSRGDERQSGLTDAPGKQRPRICLNMIVKNEAHVIERCLRSLLPYIDSWAISDTGSTDGTQDLIRTTLSGLPGELIERPWVDFAHNRNEALELAHKYGDYALVIDADDVFEADSGFEWGMLGAPGYMFEIVFGDNQSWWRVALMRLGMDWMWEGVIHEVPNSSKLAEVTSIKLQGARIRIVGGGARSKQSLQEKYLKDIEVLRKALLDLPDNPRYTFYLAQGLNESGQLHESIETYKRRVDIGGWFEEVYYSKFQIACLKERTEANYAEVIAAYIDAYEYRPQRAEAPCELARYLRLKQHYAAAHVFARIACAIPPPEDLLLVDTSVYQWRARDELAIASFSLGDYSACARLYEDVLRIPGLPAAEKLRMQANLSAARAQLRSATESAELSTA